jgi:hypothetical protein
MRAKSEANSTDEIEITPDMVEVGRETLYRFPIMEPIDLEMNRAVAEVFREMLRVRSKSRRAI